MPSRHGSASRLRLGIHLSPGPSTSWSISTARSTTDMGWATGCTMRRVGPTRRVAMIRATLRIPRNVGPARSGPNGRRAPVRRPVLLSGRGLTAAVRVLDPGGGGRRSSAGDLQRGVPARCRPTGCGVGTAPTGDLERVGAVRVPAPTVRVRWFVAVRLAVVLVSGVGFGLGIAGIVWAWHVGKLDVAIAPRTVCTWPGGEVRCGCWPWPPWPGLAASLPGGRWSFLLWAWPSSGCRNCSVRRRDRFPS